MKLFTIQKQFSILFMSAMTLPSGLFFVYLASDNFFNSDGTA